MKKVISFLILFALTAGFAVAGPPPEPDPEIESFTITTTLVGIRGSFGAQQLPLTIYVNRLSTEEEIVEIGTILREQGVPALRRRMEKFRLGKVNPVGEIGANISSARVHKMEGGYLINISTARIMPFFELYVSGRTTDYPFSFLQMVVDEEGKGQGVAIVAARPNFSADGSTLEIEAYGVAPTFQLQNVQVKLKKKKKKK